MLVLPRLGVVAGVWLWPVSRGRGRRQGLPKRLGPDLGLALLGHRVILQEPSTESETFQLTVVRIAPWLGVAWDIADDAVLAEGPWVLISDPTRFAAVAEIDVNEHVWRYTRRSGKSRAVCIRLNPAHGGSVPRG